MRTFFDAGSVAILLLASNGVWANTIYQEENGVVVFEVESQDAPTGWAAKTEIPGYLGSSYYEYTGANQYNSGNIGEHTMSFTFRIATAGNYQLHWRNRIAEGQSSTEANDSWVKFATGTNVEGEQAINGWTKAYMNEFGEWSWNARTVDHVGRHIVQYFSIGDHTMEIAGRSPGHAIDRIALRNVDTVAFDANNFEALPESSSITGDASSHTPEENSTNQPALVDSNSSTSGTCTGNVITLSPLDDLYTDGGQIINSDELRMSGSNRKTYLKFDLSSIPASALSSQLTFSVGDDAGDGTITLFAGSHSQWSEATATLEQLPSESHTVGTLAGQFPTGSQHQISVELSLLGDAKETIVATMGATDNDASILSLQSDSIPTLEVTVDADACSQFNATDATPAGFCRYSHSAIATPDQST